MKPKTKIVPHDGLEGASLYLAILVVGLTTFLTVLDSSILNVALPTLTREFKITAAESVLIVNAFQICMLIALLPLSALGERYGYRRIYLGGLTVFIVASLACATSRSFPELVLARALQGTGAAGVVGLLPAMVRTVYPARLLGRGLGLNSMLVATSNTMGPPVAAAILSVAPWQYLFVINLPLGLIALVAGYFVLPLNDPPRKSFDAVGATLTSICLGLFIFATDNFSHGGNVFVSATLIAAAVLIAPTLIKSQRRHSMPFLPLDVLRNPVIKLSFAAGLCAFTANLLALISLPFHFHTLGYNQVEIGILVIPWPLALALTAPVAGYLCDRYPPAIVGAVGLGAFMTGFLLLAFLPADVGKIGISVRMALVGFGFGLFSPPNLRQIMAAAPKQKSGVVGGLIGTNRLVGQSIGAALAAFALGFAPDNAHHIALIAAASLAAIGAVLSLARISAVKGEG